MDILLSFCIGTYNRGERVYQLVNSILACNRNDIEVVVTDNDSTDQTGQMLLNIDDPRFHYFKNSSNIGGAANVVRSLTNAGGKYGFYCNDRDLIRADTIPVLCEFLAGKDLAFAHCSVFCKYDELYDDPETAYKHLFRTYHPTGVIVNTALLLQIKNLSWFENINNVGLYPFTFLFMRLGLMGKSAMIANQFWSHAPTKYLASSKSGFSSHDNPEDVYFFPESILKNALLRQKLLIKLDPFRKSVVCDLLYNDFVDSTIKATTRFKTLMLDSTITNHYGISSQKLSNYAIYKRYIQTFWFPYKHSEVFKIFDPLHKIKLIVFVYWTGPRMYLSDIKQFLRRWVRRKFK